MHQFTTLLKSLISLTIVICCCKTNAQPVSFYGGSLHNGFIFAHSVEVQNTAGANPVGITLNAGKVDTSYSLFNACKCSVQKGISLVYFNYDNKILGHNLAVNYLFEPNFYLGKKSSLALKSEFGLAYQSNPYDAIKNPNNMSYSLPVTFYLGLSVGLKQLLSEKVQLGIYANYLHTSNGGIKDPNKGVNWPTASLQLQYYPTRFNQVKYKPSNTVKSKKPFLNVSIFTSSKTIAVGEKKRFLIYGLNANYSKPVSSVNAIIVGAEIYNDLSLKQRLVNNQLNASSIRSGFAAGNQFLLGKFNFSQQLGVYLYSPSKYYSLIYHRWMLTYQINNKLLVGVGLKAHAQVANFLDFRVGYKLY